MFHELKWAKKSRPQEGSHRKIKKKQEEEEEEEEEEEGEKEMRGKNQEQKRYGVGVCWWCRRRRKTKEKNTSSIGSSSSSPFTVFQFLFFQPLLRSTCRRGRAHFHVNQLFFFFVVLSYFLFTFRGMGSRKKVSDRSVGIAHHFAPSTRR